MSWGEFHHWLRLSLVKAVSDAAEAVAPGILVQHDGMRGAAGSDTEEWVRVSLLDAGSERQRSGAWVGPGLLQVSVFSRFGEDRADSDTGRAWKLAGLLAEQLGQTHVSVQDLDAATPAERGRVHLQEPRFIRIDERDFDTEGGEPSNVHGVAMTFRVFAGN